jgi:hypothetical protein
MKVVITQSNYIPWKGYFNAIDTADAFVFLDNVQYTKRDWRNRNKIKTPNGTKWLSIPVQVSGKYIQLIKDTKIADPKWVDNKVKVHYFENHKYPKYDQLHGEFDHYLSILDLIFNVKENYKFYLKN